MRCMGRKFYLDENKRVFQLVGKWLNISRSMNVLHSRTEVRSLLKRRKRGLAIFLFLDKNGKNVFTEVESLQLFSDAYLVEICCHSRNKCIYLQLSQFD